MRTLVTVVLLSALLGCAKSVTVHPGATSSLDSYGYDVLLVEQAVLNQARANYLAGSLPAQAKAPLNAAIRQFNVTQAAWQAYHANGEGAPALQQALTTLISVVAELQRVLGQAVKPAPPITGALVPTWRFA